MEQAEEASAPFSEGTMLTEKYRLDKLLAMGGMGAVYAGTHMQLEKRVAIKVLRKEFNTAPQMIERFQREAVLASRIGHENIVEVTDMGLAFDRSSFIVMEYLVGEDVATRIKRDGPMAAPQAADICNEILAAMAAAHAVGIVHRDLKPENVFLQRQSRGERVKIVDFGISRMTATDDPNYRLTVSGLVMGTPHYMSPEQACGESDITYKADIYAIGVILYELLTAKVPHKATNYNSLMFKVISGNYPPPSSYVPVPPVLEKIVQRAMALKPEDRFSSAAQFAEALHPFVPFRTNSPEPGHLISVDSATPVRTESASPVTTLRNPPPMKPISGETPTVLATHESLPMPAAGETSALSSKDQKTMPEKTKKKVRGLAFAGVGLTLLAALASAIVMSSSESKTKALPQTSTEAPAAEVALAPREEPAIAPTETTTPSVTISFVVTPSDAVITVDGVALADGKLVKPKANEDLLVTVSREGYQSKERSVNLNTTKEIEFVLVKEEPSTSPRNKNKRKDKRKDKRNDRRKDKRIISDSPYD